MIEDFVFQIKVLKLSLINTICDFHKLKFKIDSTLQEKKILKEVEEFKKAESTEHKCEECVDIIISCLGYLGRIKPNPQEEIYNKFLKVLKREYPDNFQHKEE